MIFILNEDGCIEKKLADAAISHFGARPQCYKAIEELTECAAAVARYVQLADAGNLAGLLDEMADATIVLEQLRLIVGEELFQSKLSFKANRLFQMIKDARLKGPGYDANGSPTDDEI